MSYEEVRAELAERYGWTFDVIDGMSFEQLESAVLGGKRSKGIPVESNADAEQVARDWRKYVGI